MDRTRRKGIKKVELVPRANCLGSPGAVLVAPLEFLFRPTSASRLTRRLTRRPWAKVKGGLFVSASCHLRRLRFSGREGCTRVRVREISQDGQRTCWPLGWVARQVEK